MYAQQPKSGSGMCICENHGAFMAWLPCSVPIPNNHCVSFSQHTNIASQCVQYICAENKLNRIFSQPQNYAPRDYVNTQFVLRMLSMICMWSMCVWLCLQWSALMDRFDCVCVFVSLREKVCACAWLCGCSRKSRFVRCWKHGRQVQ